MNNHRSVMYIHGVGGGTPKTEWFDPLNARLRQVLDSEAFDIDHDSIIDVDYSKVLHGSTDQEIPRKVRARLSDEEESKARAAYDEGRARNAQRLAPLNRAPGWMGKVPSSAAVGFAPIVSQFLKDATVYSRERRSRAAVLHEVLKSMATVDGEESLTVIAHSLGTVVLADAIPRMPANVRLNIVTIGSPLAITKR